VIFSLSLAAEKKTPIIEIKNRTPEVKKIHPYKSTMRSHHSFILLFISSNIFYIIYIHVNLGSFVPKTIKSYLNILIIMVEINPKLAFNIPSKDLNNLVE
jgi:hypothetical protein